MSIAFRRLTRAELPLLADWLERDHVRRWWPPPAEGVAAHYGPALDGLEPADHYLILLAGRPVGMIETYLVADHPEWERLVRTGPGVAGVDILIGELDAVGRDVGPEALRTFARDVVFADDAVVGCVAGVDVENRRSLRAFEKAGFEPVCDYEENDRPHRLLRLERALSRIRPAATIAGRWTSSRSATSRSSRTSTTASRRSPIGSCS